MSHDERESAARPLGTANFSVSDLLSVWAVRETDPLDRASREIHRLAEAAARRVPPLERLRELARPFSLAARGLVALALLVPVLAPAPVRAADSKADSSGPAAGSKPARTDPAGSSPGGSETSAGRSSSSSSPAETVSVVGEGALRAESRLRPLDPAPDLDSLLAESEARDRAWLYPVPDSIRTTTLVRASVFPRKGSLSLRPELWRISRDPVLVVELSSRAEIARWSVVIADPEGRPVRRYDGTGRMPQRLSWDGRDSAGRPAPVGRTYSVHLIAHDKAGNTATVAGDPATIEGLFVLQDGRPRIELPPKALFEWGRKGVAVSERGKLLLREAADILKGWPSEKVAVTCEGPDLARAESEASAAAEFLARDLLRPRGDFAASGAHPAVPPGAAPGSAVGSVAPALLYPASGSGPAPALSAPAPVTAGCLPVLRIETRK